MDQLVSLYSLHDIDCKRRCDAFHWKLGEFCELRVLDSVVSSSSFEHEAEDSQLDKICEQDGVNGNYQKEKLMNLISRHHTY